MTPEYTRGSPIDVSIVLPCYKASGIARRSIDALRSVFTGSALTWEIVVVDDGGGDFDSDHFGGDDRVTLLQLPENRGKGAAVKAGMLRARGHVRIFTDVDLPFGVDFVPVMRSYLLGGFHLVIGDRTLPASSYFLRTSGSRRLASSIFTSFVGTLVTGGFFDTQCGLKGVRGDVADALFPLLTIDRFAFDVELIYVALKHRLDIKRMPVVLLNNETSSVRLFRDASRGMRDIASIKVKQLTHRYDSDSLDDIVRRDHELVLEGALRTVERARTQPVR